MSSHHFTLPEFPQVQPRSVTVHIHFVNKHYTVQYI